MGLTNSDYEAVMREYDSIRYANAELLKKRIEEAYNKIPELKALEDEMITESAKLAKDSMYISEEAYAKAKEALDKKRTELAHKKEELLKKFNSSCLSLYKSRADIYEKLSEDIIIKACGSCLKSADIIKADEGGILGALFKYACDNDCGMRIRLKAIPITQLTVEICEYYKLNPYRLLSEVYIIFSADSEGLIYNLKKAGIDAAKIGELSKNKAKVIMDKESIEYINRTKEDEIDKLNIKLLKERL